MRHDHALRGLLSECRRLLSERGEANGPAIAVDHRRAHRCVGRRAARALLRPPGARLQPRPAGGAGQRAGLCDQAGRRAADAADPGHRAAAPGAVPAYEPRARRHGGHRADAPRAARAAAAAAAAAGGGGRPAAPAVELVQRRLPADAARRLELAGATARADHPPRGGARDRRLGRPAPAPAARPALLRDSSTRSCPTSR